MVIAIEKELEETKVKWQQTQGQLEKTKSELHDVREELERSQCQLDEVLGELEQTHFELHQLKEKGEPQQSESNGQVQQELAETKAKLQETEKLLKESQSQKETEEFKGKWQETQKQLDKTKSEFHDVKEELERSQSQLDEVLGELEQTHFELHQLKEKGGQQQSESDGQVKEDLVETKTKLQETEQLLEQSQSQLGETMGVLDEYKSQMEKTMERLEKSQEELEQVKGELVQKQPGSQLKLQKELEETKAKLKETEGLLEQYESQLQETMEVLEEYHSQLQKAHLKGQYQSESKLELKKELEETKPDQTNFQIGKSQKLSEELDEQNRLFKIDNAIVKPIKMEEKHNKWLGGVVFPHYMPAIFRHRRSSINLDQEKISRHQRDGSLKQEIVYLDEFTEVNEQHNLGSDHSHTYRGTYIYGGPFHPHFGHALTESIHRLWAFDASIHDGIVFAISALPNTSQAEYTLPLWFTQILEIIGIPLAKCVLVTNNYCIFENLIIPEPGSELTLGPKKWYFSYLEKLQQRIFELTNHLRKDKPEKLFLGRNHIPFSGIIAGENYFEAMLADEGYISLKPENYDVIEQLAYLISAKKIVFTEGSSIYLLELISCLDTEIACIPRRGGNQSFYPHLNNKFRNYIIAGNLQDILGLTDWRKHGIRKPLRINKNPRKIVESLRKHNFCSLKKWNDNQFFAEEKHYINSYINRAYNFLPNNDPMHRIGVMQKYLQVRNTAQEKSVNISMESRSDRLNKLASINRSSRYLEIGVSQGITFNAIEIDYRVAVDPKFQLDWEKYANDKVVFLEVSSNEFFRSYAKKYESFDLIYLDGLHTFEQTFLDFCASLACGHSKTIWLIDDTCPGSYAQAQSSLKHCRQIQKFSGEKGNSWMGDVFKVVAAIHDFFPQYSFATFPDHGQTVVWNQWRTDFQPQWNSLEIISRLEYSDFIELQSTLYKREPYEDIFERIRQDLDLS